MPRVSVRWSQRDSDDGRAWRSRAQLRRGRFVDLVAMRAAALGDHPIRRARAARVGSARPGGGLSASFGGVGIFLVSLGYSLGIDPTAFRLGAATLILIIGIVLLVPALQNRFALIAGPVAIGGQAWVDRLRPSRIGGQFALGMLLGAIWSPCSGPTLGAAIGLAAQSGTAGRAAMVMAMFGLGAATPILALAYGSRQAIV